MSATWFDDVKNRFYQESEPVLMDGNHIAMGMMPVPPVGRLAAVVDRVGDALSIIEEMPTMAAKRSVAPAKAGAVPPKQGLLSKAGDLGSRLLGAVTPDVKARVSDLYNRAGTSFNAVAGSNLPGTQAQAINSLLANGGSASAIRSVLTNAEELAFRAIFDAHLDSLDEQSDRASMVEVGTNAEVTRMANNLDIDRVCKLLAISPDAYAVLLRSFRSHTTDDIEAYQLHVRMYGPIRA